MASHFALAQVRRSFIGGSDARIIMGSDEDALVRLWREKRGEAEPQDLSSNLVVQLGKTTEELNRLWYQRNTGRTINDIQRRVKHSAIVWMVATLDGIVEETQAVFEAKFMLPWSLNGLPKRRLIYGVCGGSAIASSPAPSAIPIMFLQQLNGKRQKAPPS